MPWYSWSIDARLCKTGGKLHEVEGSVCEKCYALRNNYNFPVVKNAQARRLAGSIHEDFVPAFILVLKTLFGRSKGENRFRWFDAGDLQDVKMLEKIRTIALATPEIVHYLPTKEPGIIAKALKKGPFPPNLIVRISNPMVGQTFKAPPMGLSYSTVGVSSAQDSSVFHCPVSQQGNKCLTCRACWEHMNINYHIH